MISRIKLIEVDISIRPWSLAKWAKDLAASRILIFAINWPGHKCLLAKWAALERRPPYHTLAGHTPPDLTLPHQTRPDHTKPRQTRPYSYYIILN
jgi:hypothetical protein